MQHVPLSESDSSDAEFDRVVGALSRLRRNPTPSDWLASRPRRGDRRAPVRSDAPSAAVQWISLLSLCGAVALLFFLWNRRFRHLRVMETADPVFLRIAPNLVRRFWR